MWETSLAKVKASMRFPKRSTADLKWLKNVWITFGIVWIAIGVFGWSGWPAVAAVLLGVGWLVQFALSVKEIRRRQQTTNQEPPPGQEFRASQLSSRDVGIWKRIMIASAIGAAVLGLQAIISAILGGYAVTALTAPFAAFLLVIAAAIWVMLRARTKQLRRLP